MQRRLSRLLNFTQAKQALQIQKVGDLHLYKLPSHFTEDF